MEKRSGVQNIDKEYFVTISKLASKIIETSKIECKIINSDSIGGGTERTPLYPEKMWKEIWWEPKKSTEDGLEGMQNGH